MTYDGLGEIFEDDFAEVCAKKSLFCDGMTSGPIKHVWMKIEDPQRREWNFYLYISSILLIEIMIFFRGQSYGPFMFFSLGTRPYTPVYLHWP